MEQHIDVCSYHLAPPESSYSTKSTANLTHARQRIIDSALRQRDFVPTEFRPPSNSSSIDKKRPSTTTKSNYCRQFVPNLYANQRVRERSNSKDPPPIKLQKDLKKTVAFGRTTTIKESRSLTSLRPNSSTINNSNSKLQNEVQYLRSYIDSNDRLRKDVDQLQKVLKTIIEENVELQEFVHESQKSQANIKKEVQELSESNSALRTRVNLLEVWYARAKAEESSRIQKKSDRGSTFYHQNVYSDQKKLENDVFNKKKNGWTVKNEISAGRRLAQIYVGDSDSRRSSHKYSEVDEESSRYD